MIKIKKKRETPEPNSSSMADIAFLLLVFFLVTTTIVNDKGLPFTLPKKLEKDIVEQKQNQRNILKVILNSQNKLLVNNEATEVEELLDKAVAFIDNNGRNPNWSEDPEKAIISFRTDRGTDFKTYIAVLDRLKGAYHTIWSDKVGLSVDEFLKLDPHEPADNKLLQEAKEGYPFKLSEAEPLDFGKK